MKVHISRWLLFIFLLLTQSVAGADSKQMSTSSIQSIALPVNTPIVLDKPIASKIAIAEPNQFYGLAHYLNGLTYYKVTIDSAHQIKPGDQVSIGADEWFAAVGRFNVLLLSEPGMGVLVSERAIQLKSQTINTTAFQGLVASKLRLHEISSALDQLRYAHLWSPLAALAKGGEWILSFIQKNTGMSWAVSLIIFAIVIKVLLLPVTLTATRLQRTVSQHQAALAPILATIKQSYSGEDAHHKIMAAHTERGITPFFTLKPMLGLCIQIPVLIAIFNALAEMPQFADEQFLWVKDLAYPDAIASLPITIIFIGDTFNLMPWLMFLIAILSSTLFCDAYAQSKDVRRKRKGLMLMALVFLLLFYPFPAVMVFYWLLANTLQLVQQQLQRQ